MKPRIVITGAQGFVGQHLCCTLAALNFVVWRLVRKDPPAGAVLQDSCTVDLMNKSAVHDLLAHLSPDYVIHLAGVVNRDNDIGQLLSNYMANVNLSLNVIDACCALTSLKRFVFLGSCEEYGLAPTPYVECQKELPVSIYGLSKLAITQYLGALHAGYGFPAVTLRPTVIYGPEQKPQMFIPALIEKLLAGRPFLMTEGKQLRDFIFVEDVVRAILKTVEGSENINGAIINLGSGNPQKIIDVARLTAKLVNETSVALLKPGAIDYRAGEVMNYSVKIDLAKKLLKWSPETTLTQGLQKTIAHCRNVVTTDKSVD